MTVPGAWEADFGDAGIGDGYTRRRDRLPTAARLEPAAAPLDNLRGGRRRARLRDGRRRRRVRRPPPAAGPAAVAPPGAAGRSQRPQHLGDDDARRLSAARAAGHGLGRARDRSPPAVRAHADGEPLRPRQPLEPVALPAGLQPHLRGRAGHAPRRRAADTRPDRWPVLDALDRRSSRRRGLLRTGTAAARSRHRPRRTGRSRLRGLVRRRPARRPPRPRPNRQRPPAA